MTDPDHQPDSSSTETMGGEGAVLLEELRRANIAGTASRGVIVVEGASDRRALEALARRWGRDLEAEGVTIVATAGATNIARFVEVLGPGGHDVPIAGLCDEGEVGQLRLALDTVGIGPVRTLHDLAELGFFVCVRDLEDELIRALGAQALIALIASEGHLRRFRSFQNQPAQRHKTVEQQLWRWLGNHKIRYAPLMVDAADLAAMPAPLAAVLSQFVPSPDRLR